jgi:short-subunit dehydrogenase
MPKPIEYLLFPSIIYPKIKMDGKLVGKSILITGATFGIGEATVKALAKSGAELILVARTREKLIELQNTVLSEGGKCQIFAADLYQESSVDELIQFLEQSELNIDVFINNAGKSIRRSIFDSLDRFHDFTRTNSINYLNPVKLSLYLIPHLIKAKGQLINISAINVLFLPAPKWAAYQASKSAFDQWVRSVKPELKSKGVTVSSIYLPLVKTRMITPTKEYDNVPAMSPESVANIVIKVLKTKSSLFKPWWTIFPQFSSVLFRRLGEYFFAKNKR